MIELSKTIKKDLVKCYSREELALLRQMVLNENKQYYIHLLECYNLKDNELKNILNEMFENAL